MAIRKFAGLAVLWAACFRAPVPMTKLDYAVGSRPARCLVVLLPGRGSDASDFEKEGFLAKVQASGLSLDVVAANATWGYYRNRTMVPRFHDDVVAPLAAKTYEKRWLMGISLGGFGSFFYSEQYPHDFDGIFAMSPYLGEDDIVDEVKQAGGLEAWKAPPPAQADGPDYQRQLWRYLQELTREPSKGPDVWMGWGRQDRFASTDALVGDRLPQGHVLLTDGIHDWPPWNVLIERFLKEGPLATQCAPVK